MKFSERMVHCATIQDVPPQWDIEKVEAWFKGRELTETIKLDSVTTIINVRQFVDGHIAFLKNHATKPIYKPYHDRLLQLAKML